MLDFPLDGLMDEAACLTWLEKHLHPQGLKCPRCGATERRVAKQGGHFPAYRCKSCDRYHTILTILSDTALAKSRQRPSTLVLLLRGLTKGESTSRLARELSITRKQMSTIRKRLQANLYDCLPENVMEGEAAFEADELYQNVGGKSVKHAHESDPPRRRGNKRKGQGTFAKDRPPIFGVKGRTSGEVRYFVRRHADGATCREVIESTIPVGAALYTDGLSGYVAVGTERCWVHGRVFHSKYEWARDDDGDGVREVHCNGCEGMGAGLRTFLRGFRGVSKRYLDDYVAVYEATFNSKRITPSLVQALCFGFRGTQINYT